MPNTKANRFSTVSSSTSRAHRSSRSWLKVNDAVEGCRSTIGATNPIKAPPGSIRGDFAQTIGRNLVHGSDSPDSAKREIAIWFEPHELFSRSHDQERWLIGT